MKKDCLTTFSKVDFNTFEPEEDKIRIEDIAHALSMMTRASGCVRSGTINTLHPALYAL